MTLRSFPAPSAVLEGGLLAGSLDIGAAALIYGRSPVRILHNIASGLVGAAAFRGGAADALLGLALQWLMSLLIAALYGLATMPLPALRRRWGWGGALAGAVIFLVMNFLVLPLSAAPVSLADILASFTARKVLENLAAMLVFGWIIALAAARAERPTGGAAPGARGDASAG